MTEGIKRLAGKRRCMKCNGNVFIEPDTSIDADKDGYGWHEWCLQCGFRRHVKVTTVIRPEADKPAVGSGKT